MLTQIAFLVGVGERFQLVGIQRCAFSRNEEPGNSSLVEEMRSWVWVEIQEKVRVAAQI